MTTEPVENGGEFLTKSLALLLQARYYIGYFPQEWKTENSIYIRKPDRENYHQEKSYSSLSPSSIIGKYMKE